MEEVKPNDDGLTGNKDDHQDSPIIEKHQLNEIPEITYSDQISIDEKVNSSTKMLIQESISLCNQASQQNLNDININPENNSIVEPEAQNISQSSAISQLPENNAETYNANESQVDLVLIQNTSGNTSEHSSPNITNTSIPIAASPKEEPAEIKNVMENNVSESQLSFADLDIPKPDFTSDSEEEKDHIRPPPDPEDADEGNGPVDLQAMIKSTDFDQDDNLSEQLSNPSSQRVEAPQAFIPSSQLMMTKQALQEGNSFLKCILGKLRSINQFLLEKAANLGS